MIEKRPPRSGGRCSFPKTFLAHGRLWPPASADSQCISHGDRALSAEFTGDGSNAIG